MLHSLATRVLTLALLLSLTATSAHAEEPTTPRRFEISGTDFLLDGKPFQIRAGEMHYQRIPRPYWRQRLEMAKAMGLNAVATYMFWNAHEPRAGQFDFTGENDVAEFVREAQQVGLYVILRPGPYACAEWDLGGLPWWLLKDPAMRLRTQDPVFLEACGRYFTAVGQQLASLQITRGGPILMSQVENEYGSYGKDKVYMGRMRDIEKAAGFDVPLFSCDGPTQLPNDSRDDLFCTINDYHLDAYAKFRPGVPIFCSEYYPGWYDAWGTKRKMKDSAVMVKQLTALLEGHHSYNLYMLHGGTNFGFSAGANAPPYKPVETKYFNTLIDTVGRPTPQYQALREMNAKFLAPGETLPEIPPPAPSIAVPEFELRESASLLSDRPQPHRAQRPLTFEELDQPYGAVLYATQLPAGPATKLTVDEVHDMAWVFVDGQRIGDRLDRMIGRMSVDLPAREKPARLEILVEAMGRINYGPEMHDRKGITHTVTIADPYGPLELSNWEMFSFSLDQSELDSLKFNPAAASQPTSQSTSTRGPTFHRGQFQLTDLGDTFLDLRGWKKGMVWLNGHNLGRYWHIGPQQTLFAPGCWLKKGSNEVIVLEYEQPPANPKLAGLAEGILNEPHPE